MISTNFSLYYLMKMKQCRCIITASASNILLSAVALGGKGDVSQWLIKGESIGHLSRDPHQGFGGFPYKMQKHLKKTPIFGKIKPTFKQF